MAFFGRGFESRLLVRPLFTRGTKDWNRGLNRRTRQRCRSDVEAVDRHRVGSGHRQLSVVDSRARYGQWQFQAEMYTRITHQTRSNRREPGAWLRCAALVVNIRGNRSRARALHPGTEHRHEPSKSKSSSLSLYFAILVRILDESTQVTKSCIDLVTRNAESVTTVGPTRTWPCSISRVACCRFSDI